MNNISDENIVVEINRTIISKMYWDDTKIEENDKIEIITAVGGGELLALIIDKKNISPGL